MKKAGLYLLIGAVSGFTGGWLAWGRNPRPVETPAAAVRQTDGSLVLERAPDAHATPAHAVPAGDKVDRIARVVIRPRAPASIPDVPASPDIPVVGVKPVCPDVTVDLTLVIEPDGTRRVIASSPDGTVIDGVDIPVMDAPRLETPKPWAAGGYYDPLKTGFGGWVDRDVGPFRLGVEAGIQKADNAHSDFTARVRLGVRF